MKKGTVIFLVLTFAAVVFAQDSVIRLAGDERDIPVRSVTLNKDGSVEYFPADTKAPPVVIPKRVCQYIRIAKPKEIQEADIALDVEGKPEKARDLFRKAGITYKDLGWELYCMARETEAVCRTGDKKHALEKLLLLRHYKLPGKLFRKDMFLVEKQLTDLYLESENPAAAQPLVDEFMRDSDSEIASFGFLRAGDLAAKKKDTKAAEIRYLQAVLLFPDSPYCPEALYKCSELMKAAKDSRADNFRAVLKKRFPNSVWAKK